MRIDLASLDALCFARGRSPWWAPPPMPPRLAVAALSRFAAAAGDRLASLDIKPFLVRPRGQGALALDAVVVGRDAP